LAIVEKCRILLISVCTIVDKTRILRIPGLKNVTNQRFRTKSGNVNEKFAHPPQRMRGVNLKKKIRIDIGGRRT